MHATLAQLTQVRSQLAEEIYRYCTRLIDKIDRTPWFRQGKNMPASEVAVPVRVFKESKRPERSRFGPERADKDSQSTHGPEAPRAYVDPELYEEPTFERRKEVMSWLDERTNLQRGIVLGGPGSGKSFLTQITGVDLANKTRDEVSEQSSGLEELTFPIHLTLARLAKPDLPNDPAEAVLQLLREELQGRSFLTWLEQRMRTSSTWLLGCCLMGSMRFRATISQG
jgi:hypothetical protein